MYIDSSHQKDLSLVENPVRLVEWIPEIYNRKSEQKDQDHKEEQQIQDGIRITPCWIQISEC